MALLVEKLKEKEVWKEIISYCYFNDSTHITKWHSEAQNGIDACINKTYVTVAEDSHKIGFYKITNNNYLVGFFSLAKINQMFICSTFYICPNFRNKKYKKIFWDEIFKKCKGYVLVTSVHIDNKPAFEHLKKVGFEVSTKIGDTGWNIFTINTN
jgi:hypothetical protein